MVILDSKKSENKSALVQPKYQGQGLGVAAGRINGSTEATVLEDRMTRFNGHQGHGFAAEQANNLIDILHGKDAHIQGDNNAKNGADRIVDGQLIQTKYCQTARASIDASFSNGQYRYIKDGNVMQLEVPSDQYDEAIRIMQERIKAGKIPGVTDPKDATKIVRKGNVTYAQARNIAKAGNIDSLTFDATNGAIICASAFGITAVITYAKAMWNGDDTTTAIDKSLCAGLETGGLAFITTVASAQLMRTGLNKALLEPSIWVVKNLLPSKLRQAMVNALRNGANIYGAAATNNLAKLIRSNIIVNAVMFLALSANDISNAFNGKISGKQLFKNMMVLAGGLGGGAAGATGGAAIGGIIGGIVTVNPAGAVLGAKIGFYLGAAVGGVAGGGAAHKVMNYFVEDDAVKMVEILNSSFTDLAQAQLLSEEEVDIILGELQLALSNQFTLLEMFASKNRRAFADDFLLKLIQKTTCWRCRIAVPSDGTMLLELDKVLDKDYSTKMSEAMRKAKNIDPVKIGKELTGRDLSPLAAKKAWYATKQMNMLNSQAEILLGAMVQGDEKTAEEVKMLKTERANKEQELAKLLKN